MDNLNITVCVLSHSIPDVNICSTWCTKKEDCLQVLVDICISNGNISHTQINNYVFTTTTKGWFTLIEGENGSNKKGSTVPCGKFLFT